MITLKNGQVALFTVAGHVSADNGGGPAPVTGTVKVSDYNSAYVVSAGGANNYMLVPKIAVQPGQSVTVDATFSAKASDGSVIADFVVNFTIEGAPVTVPPATQLVLESSSVVDASTVTVPPDPGSDTIPIA